MTNPLHANCVALRPQADAPWCGVLIVGPSGSGKSDLTLRLLEHYGAERACLVADDYVEIAETADRLVGFPPPNIAGKMEVRGIGIVERSFLDTVPLTFVVQLVAAREIERLPSDKSWAWPDNTVHTLPLFALNPFDLSAPMKVMAACHKICGQSA